MTERRDTSATANKRGRHTFRDPPLPPVTFRHIFAHPHPSFWRDILNGQPLRELKNIEVGYWVNLS